MEGQRGWERGNRRGWDEIDAEAKLGGKRITSLDYHS